MVPPKISKDYFLEIDIGVIYDHPDVNFERLQRTSSDFAARDMVSPTIVNDSYLEMDHW
jgi:hypothetical protein